MDWYYIDNKKKVGPVTETEIELLVRQGKITSDTIVWNETLGKWQSYGSVKGVVAGSPVSQQSAFVLSSNTDEPAAEAQTSDVKNESFCAECGRKFSDDEMIHYGKLMICADCKTKFFQKIREGASLPTVMEYAGFWIRFGAKFIDGIITGLINMVFSFMGGLVTATSFSGSQQGEFNLAPLIVFGLIYILQIAFNAAYATFFVGKFAATPGKMAVGIKVVTADGSKVSFLRALGRHFSEWLSGLTLLIGYIIAAFDDEKRTLHDRICNTRVVRK